MGQGAIFWQTRDLSPGWTCHLVVFLVMLWLGDNSAKRRAEKKWLQHPRQWQPETQSYVPGSLKHADYLLVIPLAFQWGKEVKIGKQSSWGYDWAPFNGTCGEGAHANVTRVRPPWFSRIRDLNPKLQTLFLCALWAKQRGSELWVGVIYQLSCLDALSISNNFKWEIQWCPVLHLERSRLFWRQMMQFLFVTFSKCKKKIKI